MPPEVGSEVAHRLLRRWPPSATQTVLSAYTYAYATLGELFAWVIGWDLILEYGMAASTVCSGWSNHFIELLNIFHIKLPLWLAYDH